MIIYSYKAKDSQGKYQKGTIEANDRSQAVSLLKDHNFFVIELVEKKNFSLDLFGIFKPRIGNQELSNFTRHLSTMLSTGLPLTDALSNLENQSSSQFSQVVSGIRKDVTGGMAMSVSMAKSPTVFDNLYINMVKAGEASGNVDQSLSRLADILERNADFAGKIQGAMIYPAILVAAMGAVGVLMMVFVIPKISAFYSEFGSDLPLPTKILISIFEAIGSWSPLIIIGLIALAGILTAYKKTPEGNYHLSNLIYKIPVFGQINKESTLAVFCRTLGTLVASGIAIIDALKIVANILGSNVYRDGIDRAMNDVQKGFPLSMSLKNDENFPKIIAQMINIGEETGTMDKSLDRLAVFFENGVERKIKVLTTSLEPILIIVMGVAICGMAILIILPMTNVVNLIIK